MRSWFSRDGLDLKAVAQAAARRQALRSTRRDRLRIAVSSGDRRTSVSAAGRRGRRRCSQSLRVGVRIFGLSVTHSTAIGACSFDISLISTETVSRKACRAGDRLPAFTPWISYWIGNCMRIDCTPWRPTKGAKPAAMEYSIGGPSIEQRPPPNQAALMTMSAMSKSMIIFRACATTSRASSVAQPATWKSLSICSK